jgi:hypothetical protein
VVRLKVHPQRSDQTAEPVPEAGELRIWYDDDGKVHLVYNDATAGVVRGEAD